MKRPVNVKQRRYKVLPLEFPFNCKKIFWRNCVEKKDRIEPVFNRNGFYLDRQTGLTWLEINGKAWIYNERKGFQYRLDTSGGNNRMSAEVFDAIAVLVKNRMADARLRKAYWLERDMKEMAQTARIWKLHAFHAKKRLKALKAKKNCTK